MKPDTHALLAVAAELRAAGATWEAVARRVGRESSTCRKWPSRYAADWAAMEQAARARPADCAAVVPPPAPPSDPVRPARAAIPRPPLPHRARLPLPPRPAPLPQYVAARNVLSRPPAALPISRRVPTVGQADYWPLAAAVLIAAVLFGSQTAAPQAPAVARPGEARLVLVNDPPAAPPLTSHPGPTEIDPDPEPSAARPRTGTRRPVPDPDLDRLSDEDLLSRFRRGQREVFGTLVRRYQRELYGYLRRYLGDPHLADDVFQTTFVQVFSKAGQYEPGRPVRPWLYAIATNQAIDALRRAGRHPTVSLEQAETEAEGERRGLIDLLEGREVDPFDNVDAAETRELVRGCVDRLPEFLRTVLLMAYYQGLKYQEIADALDIPLGTVKSRLHAALVKLHEAWDDRVAAPSRDGTDD